MDLKSTLELLLRSGGTGCGRLLKANCKSLEASVGALSHPMVSSTCGLAVTGENYCGDSSDLQLAFKRESHVTANGLYPAIRLGYSLLAQARTKLVRLCRASLPSKEQLLDSTRCTRLPFLPGFLLRWLCSKWPPRNF